MPPTAYRKEVRVETTDTMHPGRLRPLSLMTASDSLRSNVRGWLQLFRYQTLMTGLTVTTHPVQSASAVDTRSAAGSSSGTAQDYPNAQSIDKHALEGATQAIRRELAQRVVPGRCSQAARLDEVLALVFGEQRSAAERLRFLVFAAPFARRLVLQRAAKELRVLDHDIAIAHVRELFHWCDAFDPLGARMLDLFYFAGVSVKQTALALEVHPTAVIRGLRFAKVWLGLKLGMLELISLGPRPVDSPGAAGMPGETGGSSRRARFQDANE